MNKNITEEELLLRKRARRRLVGATVLVLAAVIILPMIFDEPKPDTEKHEIDIHLVPSEDITKIPPLVLPSESFPENDTSVNIDQSELSVERSPDFSDVFQPLDETGLDDEAIVQTEKHHVPIPGIKPRFDIAQTPRVSSAATPSTMRQQTNEYVVQLGAFSEKLKAQQQHNNLISSGINAYTEIHTVNGKPVTRVRVGPFANRQAAESELEKLRKLGLDGVVVPK